MAMAALVALSLLSSCSERDSKGRVAFKVTPTTTTVSGPMSEYLRVVDKGYNYMAHGNDDDEVIIELMVERDIPEDIEFGLGVDVFDSSETTIGTSSLRLFDKSEADKLRGLHAGETASVRIVNNVSVSNSADPVYIRITSTARPRPECQGAVDATTAAAVAVTDSAAVATDDTTAVADSIARAAKQSRAVVDGLLDELEQLADKAQGLRRQIDSGNEDVRAEYDLLVEQTSTLLSRITSMKGDMTAAQAERFTRLKDRCPSRL